MVNSRRRDRYRFWQGNIAVAEGAIHAGCRFYAGYPITPSSEIFEYLAEKLPTVGGICIQMEDEIAALGAVIGASWAGVKAMTATSGPGFSLMQEHIGYAAMTETPCVIVNVMRGGPSTGQATLVGQGDVYQARYGTHGADHELITLVPSTVGECYELTIQAFNFAEEYRTPVILLSDEHVARMRESIELPLRSELQIINRKTPRSPKEPIFGTLNEYDLVPPMPHLGAGYNVLVTGSTHDPYGFRRTRDGECHRRLVRRLARKITANSDKIVRTELHEEPRAKIGVISYGSVARAVREAQDLGKTSGIHFAHLRLITLWPFPESQVRAFVAGFKHIIVPELNSGLMCREIERFTDTARTEVHSLTKIGGGEPITPQEVLELAEALS
jgi:2-oxoglutarate ferredoxin oxidoreductase subunit alpha